MQIVKFRMNNVRKRNCWDWEPTEAKDESALLSKTKVKLSEGETAPRDRDQKDAGRNGSKSNHNWGTALP